MRRMRFLAAALFVATAASVYGQQVGWLVKPEWVRAHEEFLASDVMSGRGSATRDEEIAATYVAAQFMAYGLKPAPGMAGYLQSAEIDAPILDGHASLSVGGVNLAEGQDFHLLIASGANAAGPVRRVSAGDLPHLQPMKGAVILMDRLEKPTTSVQAVNVLRRSGAAVIVVVEDDSTVKIATMLGGKTRTPIALKEQVGAGRAGATVMSVTAEAMARLTAAAGAGEAKLTVRQVPMATRKTFNAIGYLEGLEPKSGTILLTAHLDHLGVGTPVNGDGIFNGANDDAAGTTAVLELAHAMGSQPRTKRNVLFVCYGSEEAGELGSTFFGEHPPVPIKELVTNLEFEMIGNQDPKMPKGVLLLTGWERSNLGPTLKAHGALLGPDPYPEEHYFERSDNYALALKGLVAHTAAGWGSPPTYHQPSDDIEHLDLQFMTAAIQSLVEPVRWLADSDFTPEWNKGGKPERQ